MGISAVALVFFVLAYVVQGFLSSIKRFYWGFIIPAVTATVFLVTHKGSIYGLLIGQLILYAVVRILVMFLKSLDKNKKNTEADKMKIKDL